MCKFTRSRLSALRLLAISVVLSAIAAAQTNPIRISGRVHDSGGADIPNTCVTIKVPGSASVVSALRTNDKGEYLFAAAPADSYTLAFWADGFVRRSVTLKVEGEAASVPPVLLELSRFQPDFEPPSVEENILYQARLHREGTLVAHESCTLDLDEGKAICPARDGVAPPAEGAEVGDLLIKREGPGLYLASKHGSTLGIGLSCADVNYAGDPVRIDDLRNGSAVCVRTKEGRSSELWIWSNEPVCFPGEIRFSFVTWKRRPLPN